jgi:Cu/Ag efflux pump CusA
MCQDRLHSINANSEAGSIFLLPHCVRVMVRKEGAELLSALIGSISLIPFIISSGTGAEIEKPLAIVVVGGLLTSPIKIVILPMVYEWVERGAARREARGAAREAEATLE